MTRLVWFYGLIATLLMIENGLTQSAVAGTSYFPDQVHLRSSTETYNRSYYWILREGLIWIKPNFETTGRQGEWQVLEVPKKLKGRAAEISADDQNLFVTNELREVYTMHGALDEIKGFNWTDNWGPPFWAGPGIAIPVDAIAWSASFYSPREDQSYIDTAGNEDFNLAWGVTSLYTLRGDGQRLTYLDPWLPLDESYEVCGPLRGRFRAVNLSSSGSTLFLINEYGDMFTRLHDFDIAGNNILLPFSYYDQRGVKKPVRQLPPPPWVAHPKIRGQITDRISVSKWGTGGVHRTLRVEGVDERGNTGYYQKDVTETSPDSWVFHPTGEPLQGRFLSNVPDQDRSGWTQGPSEDRTYVGEAGGGVTIEAPDFNAQCSPARLRVNIPGDRAPLELILHTHGHMRQWVEKRAPSDQPQAIRGAIEIPEATLKRFNELSPQAQKFLKKNFGAKRFTWAKAVVSLDRLKISHSFHYSWKLKFKEPK